MIEIHTDSLHPPAAILLYQIIDVSKYNRIPASSHFIPQSFQRDVLKALACFDRAALQCWVGRHAESKLLKWEPHWVHVNLVLNGTSHHHLRREIGRVFGGSGGSAIQRFPLIEKPKTYWGTLLIEFGAHYCHWLALWSWDDESTCQPIRGVVEGAFDWFCICPSAFYSGFILLYLTKDDGACWHLITFLKNVM